MHPAKPGVFYQNGGTFPRRCGRHIVRSDFLLKVTSHSFCRSSFPNRPHFVGLRLGFGGWWEQLGISIAALVFMC